MSPAKRPARKAGERADGKRPTNASRKAAPARKAPRDAAGDALLDYLSKTAHEASRLSRKIKGKGSGHPAPLGDPASGVLLVVEEPVGPRVLEALRLSLEAVGLPDAYVTYAATGLLGEEILAVEPRALVAVGPGAAREIDALHHPLVRNGFSEAEAGVWFPWTRGTAGLLLPALVPALDHDAAKKNFWLAFKALRALAPPPEA